MKNEGNKIINMSILRNQFTILFSNLLFSAYSRIHHFFFRHNRKISLFYIYIYIYMGGIQLCKEFRVCFYLLLKRLPKFNVSVFMLNHHQTNAPILRGIFLNVTKNWKPLCILLPLVATFKSTTHTHTHTHTRTYIYICVCVCECVCVCDFEHKVSYCR